MSIAIGSQDAAARVGTRLLKLAVVLLSSVNAVLWEVYTEAPVMAALWVGIGVSFVYWIIDDIRS